MLSVRPHLGTVRLAVLLQRSQRLGRDAQARGHRVRASGNAFLRIADLERAQVLANAFSPDVLHRRLDRYAQWLCPVLDVFGQSYHWSIRQAEYSTDLMFRSEQILVPLYDAVSRQAVLAANAERVSGFLGKKVTPQLAQEIGSRLSTRIEGWGIKHYMGAAGVKVYDKFFRVLRVETIRDKIAAAKRKGMWMGGCRPSATTSRTACWLSTRPRRRWCAASSRRC